jgi:hypothetical protein
MDAKRKREAEAEAEMEDKRMRNGELVTYSARRL